MGKAMQMAPCPGGGSGPSNSSHADDGAPDPERHRRYVRQTILPGFGVEAQDRLRAAHALVVGCGALGCAAVDLLARAGIGTLTLVDRDVVEESNLQRQTLFTERDAREGVPKAIAAKRRVAEINSQVRVHACVEHLGASNVEELVRDCSVIVDGLDNFRTRYTLNDAAVKLERPFVHAGAVGWRGTSMPVLAGVRTAAGCAAADAPCLRCLFPDAPAPGEGETCDTAGVFGPVVAQVAAHAAAEVIRIAAGLWGEMDRSLWQLDARTHRTVRVPLKGAARQACPCCGARRFDFLDEGADGQTAVLCGRNAVQVLPAARVASAADATHAAAHRRALGAHPQIDLAALARRLMPHGTFAMRGTLLVGTLHELRARDGTPIELTVFADGRAIVRGSTDEDFAKSVYDRLVGS